MTPGSVWQVRLCALSGKHVHEHVCRVFFADEAMDEPTCTTAESLLVY